MRSSDLVHHIKSLLASPASLTLAGLILVIHAITPSAAGGSDAAVAVYHALGLRGHSVLQGSVWQVVTYSLLHGGWAHVMLNAAGLVLIGSRIERILGSAALVRACFSGILLGALFHIAVTGADASAPILVGTSAAVMALLLMLTTLSPDSRMWPIPVSGRSLGLGLLIAEGLLAMMDPEIGVPLLSGLGTRIVNLGGGPWFEIAHACHFGGGVAGWFAARWLLRNRLDRERLRRARERGEAKRGLDRRLP